MKKLTTVIMAALLLFSCAFFCPKEAQAATTVTQATFQEALEKFKTNVYPNGSTYVDDTTYGGIQCFGYANQLAKYIYGSYPTTSMSGLDVTSGWTVSYGADAVDNLHIGDIVRFYYHSIFITDIYDGCVYYTDANGDGQNTVSWEGYFPIYYLKNIVSEKLSSGVSSVDGIWHTGWVAHYENWKELPTSTISYDANGGYGIVGDRKVEEGASFTTPNANLLYFCDYKVVGYTIKRNNDNKFYVSGTGWFTEDEIKVNGYSKKVYGAGQKYTLDSSWTKGISGTCSYTAFAVWGRPEGSVAGDFYQEEEVAIDIKDAMAIFRHVANKTGAVSGMSRADINMDLKVDITDAMAVFYYVAKKTDTLGAKATTLG